MAKNANPADADIDAAITNICRCGTYPRIRAAIKITADGSVLLVMHRSEMGQGVHTALAMLVADELDVPLSRVHSIAASPDKLYGNVAAFVGTLPFDPRDTEPGQESRSVKTGQWIVSARRRRASDLGAGRLLALGRSLAQRILL